MKSDFLIALTQLVSERHLPKELVLEAIEAALASAFRKDSLTAGHNISVKLNPNTGEIKVYLLRTVVEEVADPGKEVTLEEARKVAPNIQLDETLATQAMPQQQASRIAAQTAKQVVLQRLRETERDLIFKEFEQQTNDIVSGTVERLEAGRVLVNLGRAEAVIPHEEQVPLERYRRGQRLKVYVVEVRQGPKGPEIIVSRSHRNLVKRLFELEVPEVQSGVVEIKSIAREAGNRSKVAVASRQQGVDPVGSCIGMRGNRIQNIVNELHGEKIDVVRWDKDVGTFISNALSPSEVVHVEVVQAQKSAVVVVPERQLSLAIGREGQNARLAAKLTGWHLDVKSMSEWEIIKAERQPVVVEAEEALEAEASVEEIVAEEAVAEAPQEKVVEEAPAQERELLVAEQAREEVPVGVVEEAGPVEEGAGISPEEELAALEALEVVAEEEEAEPLDITEDIWKVPAIQAGAGQIRFAEDITENFRGDRQGRRKGRSGRRSGGKGGQRASRSTGR